MGDEIVLKLRSNSRKRLQSLKESMPIHGLKEADEEEEKNEIPAEDETPEMPDMPEEEMPEEEAAEDEESEEVEVAPADDKNQNPLDNPYAVNYQIGDTVSLSFADGTKTKVSGIIEGYDKEGFYRIKWDSGKTTNGITDLALAELVEDMTEKCVCGSEEFVTEGAQVVCDKCGRVIKENKSVKESKLYDIRYNYDGDELSDYASNIMVVADSPDVALQLAKEKEPEGRHFTIEDTYDSVEEYKEKHPKSNRRIVQEDKDPLSKADAARPKGRRLIRSEAHPVSTEMTESASKKQSIGDSIRKAFKKNLKEGSKSYKGYEIYIPTEDDDYEVYIKKDGKDLVGEDGNRLQFNWISHAKEYIDSLTESAEDNVFSRLNSLRGEFWTRFPELLADIRELGYDVLDANSEYVVVGIEDEEEEYHQMKIPVGGTARTMTLDIQRAEIV